MSAVAPPPDVAAGSLEAWRAWLAANHRSGSSIWLVTWKKGRGPHLAYADARDEALCWGWVDSQVRKIDADRSATRMSPRSPRSAWSAINRARIEALTAAGRMQPAGLAAAASARASGMWDAIALADDPGALPADVANAISEQAPGDPAQLWLALSLSRRRAFLEQIALAKTGPTRERRVRAAAAAAMAAGEQVRE